MDIYKLYYFTALAKTKSFSETAEVMYTTQGNVSKQIASLEKELDTILVDRHHRQIQLTEAGQTVLRHAQMIIQNYEDMQKELKLLKGSRKQIRICSIPVMAHYQITSHLSDFRKLHPEIDLVIEEQDDHDMINKLSQGHFDFAFLRTQNLHEPSLERKILCQDYLAVVLPASHPFAKRSSLSLQELKQESFLFLDPGTSIYHLCMQACRKAGFEPKVMYTGSRMENIVAFVAEGAGISLMMHHAMNYLNHDKIKIVRLQEKIVSDISLVRLKKHQYPYYHEVFWHYISEINWEGSETSKC